MFSGDASLKEAQVPAHSRCVPTRGEILTFFLPHLLTGVDMAKCWALNRYTWGEYVDREEAQEAEFRELYADLANDGWFSD